MKAITSIIIIERGIPEELTKGESLENYKKQLEKFIKSNIAEDVEFEMEITIEKD